jgi:hypothetical protein
MIKLTVWGREEPIWINKSLVTTLTEYEGKTVITFDCNNEIHVIESLDDISNKWGIV